MWISRLDVILRPSRVEEFEYRSRRVQHGGSSFPIWAESENAAAILRAPTMNGVEAAGGFAAGRPNEGFDRGGLVCPHIWQPCGERDAIAFSEVLSRSLYDNIVPRCLMTI